MTVWRMNLIDNRESENRCKDPELKFRICMENSILESAGDSMQFSIPGRTTECLPISLS